MANDMDLTPEELKQLSQLQNPDTPPEYGQYEFGPDMEQNILAAMMTDRAFMTQITDLVRPEFFRQQARQTICQVVRDYWEKYKDIPSKEIVRHDIYQKTKSGNKPLFFYEAELSACLDNFQVANSMRDYLLDQIEEFAKVEAFKYAYKKSASILLSKDPGKWTKMADILRDSFNVSRQKDIGLDYFAMLDERYARMKASQEAGEVFITGFGPLDQAMASGGIGRGEIAAFVALPGVGKSVLLVQTAIENLNKGKKVLFLSLEMDQDKVAKRFDAMLTNTGIQDLLLEHKYVIKTLRDGILPDILCQTGDDKDVTRLVVKQFPAGTADVNTFRAYTSQLYQSTGFRPDLVLVDYVGEMKDYPNMPTWESRQRLCRDLRAWGIESGHATFTALQPRKEGREKSENMGVMDDSAVADSFGQVRVLDAMWTIMQSRQEKAMNLARIYSAKVRDGKSGVLINVKQNPATLRFSFINEEDFKKTMSLYKEQKMSDTTFDDGKARKKKFKPNSSGEEFGGGD